MRRRSASSVRSSGRRRVESARSHRYVERSLSACSGMSRPGTAPASRSRIEQAEEPTRIEPVERQEAYLETKDMVMSLGGAEIEEATSVHEEEQGGKQGYCCHASFKKNVVESHRVLFEAGGRTYCPVVSHSMSGTLKPIFGSFFYFLFLLFYFLKRT